MFAIDLKSKKSIYEQIVNGFKHMIVSGELEKNGKMPSVRDLAESLTVNPNTIQKAYRELEQQGWIYSVSGRGNFVSEEIPEKDENKIQEIYGEIGNLLTELKYYGIDNNQILRELEKKMKEQEAKNVD